MVASVDPAALKVEIASLNKLIDQARGLEKREIETKLTRLKSVLRIAGTRFLKPISEVDAMRLWSQWSW